MIGNLAGRYGGGGPSGRDFMALAFGALRPQIDDSTRIMFNRYGSGLTLPSYGMGSMGRGFRGMGAYSVWDVSSKAPEALAALDALDRTVQTVQQAVSSASAQPGVGGALSAIQGQVQSMASWSASARGQVTNLEKQFGQGAPPNTISFQQSDQAWNQIATIAQQAQANASTANGYLSQIQSTVAQAQAQQAAQAQAAAAAQAQQAAQQAQQAAAAASQAAQQAAATVTGALLQAQSLAATNPNGALAMLQNPNVVAAAQQTGRVGDLQALAAAISSQLAQQTKADALLQQQIAACSAKGGTWNGVACDMAAALAAQQQQLAVQQQQMGQQQACMSAGGTWGTTGCDMSMVIQAQRDAQAAQAQASLAAQANAANAAAQARADAQAQQEFQLKLQEQQFAMQQKQQLPSVVMQLLPLLATNPSLARVIIQILTGQTIDLPADSGAMSVPGESGGGVIFGSDAQPRQQATVASMSKYADFGGAESF